MKNDRVVIILALVCGLLVGGLIGRLIFPKVDTKIITVYDSSKEKAKIDSLEAAIKVREQRIEELVDSAKQIKTVVIVKEIEKVRELPASENVELLHENLVKHGELTAESDTLPKLVVLNDKPDSLALLSEDNVKDVNIIVAKYEGELEINEKLESALLESESIVSQKDSIMTLQSDIFIHQEQAYSNQIRGLEKNLKAEKVKKGVAAGVLGALATVLGILALSK